MFCLRLHLTFDSENCSENNTKFTIVFAKMIITILLEYFLKFIGLDENIKYKSYVYQIYLYTFLQFDSISSHKTYVSTSNHLIVLVLCILSDCNFDDLLQPKCDINLHVQHLSYYISCKVCRISWPFSRTNIAIIKR